MGVYGRNFWFLAPPRPDDRQGRYVLGEDILIGTPVVAGTDMDLNGQREITPADADQAPLKYKNGILVYENPFAVAPGFDPVTYGYGDFDTAPSGQPAQVVSGSYIRFRLKNTAEETIDGQRTYPARVMVAGLGATPTLDIDDFIGPATTPSDVNGYWQECSEADAWAIVTQVYDTDELDAQLIF